MRSLFQSWCELARPSQEELLRTVWSDEKMTEGSFDRFAGALLTAKTALDEMRVPIPELRFPTTLAGEQIMGKWLEVNYQQVGLYDQYVKKHSCNLFDIPLTWPAKDDPQPKPKPEWKPCEKCKQTGVMATRDLSDGTTLSAPCPVCDGRGWRL